jgi:hypothetical protein
MMKKKFKIPDIRINTKQLIIKILLKNRRIITVKIRYFFLPVTQQNLHRKSVTVQGLLLTKSSLKRSLLKKSWQKCRISISVFPLNLITTGKEPSARKWNYQNTPEKTSFSISSP